VIVEVIVKLETGPAAASTQRQRVDACAQATGTTLSPLHPDVTDPELSSYFVTRVDETAAPAIVARLQKCAGVDGAYIKPQGEAP
jgi:hypothetical protein